MIIDVMCLMLDRGFCQSIKKASSKTGFELAILRSSLDWDDFLRDLNDN